MQVITETTINYPWDIVGQNIHGADLPKIYDSLEINNKIDDSSFYEMFVRID